MFLFEETEIHTEIGQFLKDKVFFFSIKIHEAIILSVVVYGCETWSLTAREERRERVLRRIFGTKRAR